MANIVRVARMTGQGMHRTAHIGVVGVGVVELHDENQKWQSLVFKDVRSRVEAEKRLSLLIADRERGKLNLSSKKVIPTFKEFCKEYLESISTGKENTVSQKRRAVKALTTAIGDYRLDRITPFIIERYCIDKQKAGLKPSSINVDTAILKHILNQAINRDLIIKNPCSKVKALKVAQSRERILSSGETNRLLSELRGQDRLMILTSLFTGMRLNEVIGLAWSDIDFQNKFIEFSQCKTGKEIKTPLSGYLLSELKAYESINE